jgi:hypothetical protein
MLDKVLSDYLKLASGGRQYAGNIWYKSSKLGRKKSAVKFTGNVHLVMGHSAHLYLLYVFHIYHGENLKSHKDYRVWTQLQRPSEF